MMTYLVSDKAWQEHTSDAVVCIVPDTTKKTKLYTQVLAEQPQLATLVQQRSFTGKAGQVLVAPCMKDNRLVQYILVGSGELGTKKSLELYRRALGTALRQAKKVSAEQVVLPVSLVTGLGVTKQQLAQETATILTMTDYRFNTFITDPARKKDTACTVTICTDAASKKSVKDGVTQGDHIGRAVNKTRHWIDMPPSDLTPPELAKHAQQIAKERNLEITVFNEKQVNDMGMGGLAAVSRGSRKDCKCVVLKYRAKRKKAPTIAFVGKGITFDSGGLSLKPAQYMETMKEDMSGAAAVLGAMDAVGRLQPDVHVVGIMPLAENLPGESAVKPGDIITFYNGKTAEILNTDAEGRLVLADALAYASKEIKPDAMIDLATLTGACQHALGPFFSGLMSQHDDVAKKIEDAGKRTGDRVWPLPFDDDYKAAIVSDVADIRNTGKPGYYAGSVTAGFFLQNFVGDTPWAHLDIAGTAFKVPDRSYFGPGATGAGVRLLIDLVMRWS